jgi:hypothetical protein
MSAVRLAVFALLCALFSAAQAFEPRMTFAPDRAASHTAARYARDMVQFAQVELGLKLDYSDASVAALEDVAGALQADLRRERGSLREVDSLLSMMGGYLGEVYRRNHGGEWGYVSANGRRVLAVRAQDSDAVMWPIERIKQRMRGGNNLLAYYQSRVSLVRN